MARGHDLDVRIVLVLICGPSLKVKPEDSIFLVPLDMEKLSYFTRGVLTDVYHVEEQDVICISAI